MVPTMAPASSFRAALAMALACGLLTCGRTPIVLPHEGPTVDAHIYALGFCSLKCYRLEQCGLADEPRQTCENACIEDAVESVPNDPCWAEWIEVRRCWVRRAECDGVGDEELPVGSTLCEHREQELDACEG